MQTDPICCEGTKSDSASERCSYFIVIRNRSRNHWSARTLSLADEPSHHVQGDSCYRDFFQPEIRRGLEHLGRSSLFKQSKSEQQEDEKMILSFDKAIQYMSKRKNRCDHYRTSYWMGGYIETGLL